MNILCIGAHPDDIELGCGGTLIKAARNGHRIFMYVLTRGGASGDPGQRTRELIDSANFIGAEKLWLDSFEDSRVTVSSKLINHLEYFIYKANPDVIFTHSIEDYHHDHRAIAEATLDASRNHQNVLAYELPITKKFTPQIFSNITDTLEEKTELIKIFRSQQGKVFTKQDSVIGLAQYRAIQNRLSGNISAVESFEVLKMYVDNSFQIAKLQQHQVPLAVSQGIDFSEIFEYGVKSEASQEEIIDLQEPNSVRLLQSLTDNP